ncbi:hypothetical protein BDP81DRAFT_15866 [Colletotrichum phormii]|uniref:Uncharacterized protein n=1 Tax=Colletotrichum phormii TaxID=359342 RepID=A0AAJ0A6S6_9PEZI|nr:uncharacterized protein BDP81DRAFT_15866 [Colletotrichum phormii]KAK1656126.1 hypothetical protein BDP81DRAFT_15866 [Colletotrichum phormii]
MASRNGTKSVIIFACINGSRHMGGGGRRRSYGGIFAAFCVCTITLKKRVDLRFEFFAFCRPENRAIAGSRAICILDWRRKGLPNRIARDQSLGECDWALDGRSERGDQNEPTRNTISFAARGICDPSRFIGYVSSHTKGCKRHGTCYYNFIRKR